MLALLFSLAQQIFQGRGNYAPRVSNDHVAAAILCGIVLVCAAVIVLQYARRRTRTSIIILASTLLVSFAFTVYTVYIDKTGARDYLPIAPGQAPPVQISLDLTKLPFLGDRTSLGTSVEVPFVISGVPAGHSVDINAIGGTAEAPGIAPVVLPWRPGTFFLLGPVHQQIGISLPQSFAQQAHGKPITLHLTLAVTDSTLDPDTPFVPQGPAFNLPDGTHCELRSPDGWPTCLYLSQGGRFPLLRWTGHPTCPASSPQGLPEVSWGIGDHRASVGVLSSISAEDASFPASGHHYDKTGMELCPGDPIHFTKTHPQQRLYLYTTLPPIQPKRANTEP